MVGAAVAVGQRNELHVVYRAAISGHGHGGPGMRRLVRRLAALAALALVLAGCRIEVIHHGGELLPDGREFSAYGEVEALPNGEFVVAGCLRDDNSNPGTGVTVFAPDGTVRRVLLRECFGVEQDSVSVAATADGTIYYTRARGDDARHEYYTDLVRVPPGGDEDDGVVVYTDEILWLEARFRDPVVSPDGSIVLVRRLSHAGDVATVTGPTTLEPRPGTAGIRLYEVRNDGTIVAARNNNTVVTIAPDGTETVIAGTGDAGFSGDGGPATQATLNGVWDVAETPTGAILVTDYGNGRVRRIGPDGIIHTVAGGGTQDPDDGGLAIDAYFDGPHFIAYDGTQENVGDEFWVIDNSGDLTYVGIR